MLPAQVCVRRKAVLSLLANPYCESIEHAQASVEAVYDRCEKDTEPFGSVPW
jgi:inner membrane protease ATP23